MADHFRIGAHIGSGGFGTVEEATRIADNGSIVEDGLAQKKLLPKWETDAEALARFRREVRILSEMDHPHILPVLGRNLSDKPPWFIMPRAETTLLAEIEAGKHKDEHELGPSHNRWHVGDVVAGLLQEITEQSEAEMAAEVIRDLPTRAIWFEPYVRNRPLSALVSKALASVRPAVDDDIPF